jgi:hypothetical protein
MIQDMSTVWLYAYSSDSGSPITAYHTVYTSGGNQNRPAGLCHRVAELSRSEQLLGRRCLDP